MSMISIEGRPKTWDEVKGQDICKALLKKVVADPDNSPRCILVYGSYGSGKTTCARILAAELNHMPYEDLSTSPYLQELDSSQLNLETIRNLIESWYSVPASGYRLIILDEVHLLSKQVMSALLKVFEDTPPRTIFYMATTDVDKVLDTIRSRSLEIKIETLNDDQMRDNIESKAKMFNIEVDDEVIKRITQIAKGHPRSADMELSKYEMLGRESYLSLFKSSYSEIERFLLCCAHRNKEEAFKAIDRILSFPLCSIQEDFDKVLLDMLKAFSSEGNQLSKAFGANTLAVFKKSREEWFSSSFSTDVELQCALLCFLQMFLGTGSSTAQAQAKPAVQTRR